MQRARYSRPFTTSEHVAGIVLLPTDLAALRTYVSARIVLAMEIDKQFTAAGMLLLAEQGKLKIDDNLSLYLPNFPRANEVTLRDLLDHTSGIHNFTESAVIDKISTSGATVQELVADIAGQSPLYDFEPGKGWWYSNSNYALLGAVIEKVSGETWGRVGYKSRPHDDGLAQDVSSSPSVVVMKPTENGNCVNAAARLGRPWNRLLLPKGLVRARSVVEADVLRDDAPEVILAKNEDVVEHLSAERAHEAFSEGIHVRRACRRSHHSHPDELKTLAKRDPSLLSWSHTRTCGARSIVAFLACCAHHSSVGAYVTAAYRIVRRRRSRKKSTKTSRNRMSNVCTKLHAHVTWFRRNVDQLCPSPRGCELRIYL